MAGQDHQEFFATLFEDKGTRKIIREFFKFWGFEVKIKKPFVQHHPPYGVEITLIPKFCKAEKNFVLRRSE